jgi:hypothetical protein
MRSLAFSVLLPRLRVSVAAVVGVAALLVATGAQAQSYPSRPVRVVVPFAPGGATDATARLISKHLSQRLGQTFIMIGVEVFLRTEEEASSHIRGKIRGES